MADKKIIAIVAIVVVVAIVAVAAFVLLSNNNGGDKPSGEDFSASTRMLIYGNANNDDYLNSDDVKYIQGVIDGTITWDKKNYPFVDTNTDGKITSDDVTLLQKFLDGKSATMYYMNWYGETKTISYPLSGNIVGSYIQVADLCIVVGVYDKVVGIKDTAEKIKTYDQVQYPNGATQIKSVRGDTNVFDVQKCLAVDANIVLSDPFALTDSFVSGMKAAKPTVNIIELPINRSINNIDWTHTIITLGGMMNLQKNTEKYVKYVENVESKISEKLDAVKKKYSDETFLICYMPSNETTTDLDILGKGVVQYGDVINMLRLPVKCSIDPLEEEGYIENYPIEKVITNNPSIICVETWGFINSYTEEEYVNTIKTMVDYFKATGAYKNNRVVSMAYEVFGTVPGMSGLISMGAILWPDIFSEEEGIKLMNEYYRNFTYLGSDFDVSKLRGYLPEQWGATI
jgi:hypothetical protein